MYAGACKAGDNAYSYGIHDVACRVVGDHLHAYHAKDTTTDADYDRNEFVIELRLLDYQTDKEAYDNYAYYCCYFW